MTARIARVGTTVARRVAGVGALLGGVLLMACAATSAFACDSCYGAGDGPMIDGARAGIWLLLGVTIAMQAAFAAFFFYLRRQARRAAEQALDEEWTRLQQSWSGPRSMEQP